jgi:hypothetical protein
MILRLPICLLLLAGCSGGSLPPATISSVTPMVMIASQPTPVEVQLNVELPSQVDYAEESITFQTGLRTLVGPQEVGSGLYPPGGLVRGTLATILALGTYDVVAVFADGRRAVRHDAFTVVPGSWPAGYNVDPIGNQRSGVPFSATLRATGTNAASFAGNVLLEASGGAELVPAVSGAFDAGVRVETVTVIGTGQHVLTVSDIAGNSGQSPSFTISP